MLRAHVIFITLLLIVWLVPVRAQVQPHVSVPQDLSGQWRFALDRFDEGVTQQWFSRRFPEFIKLPGILQAQYQGDEITTKTPWVLSLYDRFWYLREDYKDYSERNVKVPFLSQPPRHYLGVAWYQKDFNIPSNWVGRRVVLTLERPHWETTVWLDNRKIGSDRSLVAPHVFDFGTVSQGRHVITIRVDNRMILPYRPDAHSVSDSLASSWNGIAGKIQLSTTGRVWIDDVQVFPNLSQRSMLIKVRVGNQTGLSGSGTLTAVWPDIGVVPITWDDNGGSAEVTVPIRPEAVKWDEFHPQMYPLSIWLKGNNVDETFDLNVGLRDFKAEGKEFQLNGRAIIFRGTHHGGDFPLTGYPPTDVASWKKLFELCRAWGLNHMRFHSWCPPEAAFEAADMVGFYLQPEPGMWNEINPNTPMERVLYQETGRMIRAYGNHPSFMLLSASNEPKGNWQPVLAGWTKYFRMQDPRRLYTRGTGHTERQIENLTEGSDFLAIQRIGPKAVRRESGWFGGDYETALEDINIPVISHEIGQWSSYPNFEVIKKFSGGYMKPGNYEIFRESAKAHGLLEKNSEFAQASGEFQVLAYKEEIEANLRTRGLSGFQLLDLHDYLGQGTALVGLLDPFWETKGYIKPEEFKDFCNATVPLARFHKYVFTDTERLDVPVEVAHYGAEPMEDGKGVWHIDDMVGEWDAKTIPIGKNTPLGGVYVDLAKLGPGEHTLTVTLAPSSFFTPITRKIISRPGVVRGSTYFENSWKFWVFPTPDLSVPQKYEPPLGSACPLSRVTDVLVTNSWDEAQAKLATGGKVLFAPRSNDLDWSSPPLDVVPIFWNRQMMPAWGRMLGLSINRKAGETQSHMLMGFYTSSHFDWQWAEIIRGVRAINMERLPVELEPVVWAIDDWNRNYKLGLLFEGVVGNGKLLVSAIDVTKETANPVLYQLRKSLLTYMKSDCFQPTVGISRNQMRGLLFDNRIMAKLGAKAEVDGASASSAIDGDPTTFMLVGDQKAPVREQIEMTVSFPAPVAMAGVVLMGRQNHREHEGDIREYSVQISDDGKIWSEIARGELLSSFAPQYVGFSRVNTARYLKLISLSGFGTDKTTALAELAVIYAGPKLPQ
ncbi:MAG TPA: discoidin domain-containing protein [Pyrinomonadaceae bacterium]|nr:discoidin domain-containing protein [Pyrinomonadaceae bacterium]